MPLPKSIHAYEDVLSVLVEAIKHETSTYTCDNAKAAVRWRQEAYYLRKLLQQQSDNRFDHLMLTLDDNKVHIKKRSSRGVLTTPDGEVSVKPVPLPPEDELERAAFEFAKSLGLDEEDD